MVLIGGFILNVLRDVLKADLTWCSNNLYFQMKIKIIVTLRTIKELKARKKFALVEIERISL